MAVGYVEVCGRKGYEEGCKGRLGCVSYVKCVFLHLYLRRGVGKEGLRLAINNERSRCTG